MDGPDREASSLVLMTGLRAAMGPELEFEASLPVSWLNARDGAVEEEKTGTGDLLTRVHLSRNLGHWTLGASAGVYWPVSNLDGAGLPEVATFVSGTIDPVLGLGISGGLWSGIDVGLFSSARLVVSDFEDGRRLGSTFTTTASIRHVVSRKLSLQGLVTHLHRQTDTGNMMEDSGGDWIYLQPQAAWKVAASGSRAWQFLMGLRLPVHQNVRGTQLVDSPSFLAGLSVTM